MKEAASIKRNDGTGKAKARIPGSSKEIADFETESYHAEKSLLSKGVK